LLTRKKLIAALFPDLWNNFSMPSSWRYTHWCRITR